MTGLRVLVDSAHPQWALALRMAGVDCVEAGGLATDGDRADVLLVDGTGEDAGDRELLQARLAVLAERYPGLPLVVCADDVGADELDPDRVGGSAVVRPPLTPEVLAAAVRDLTGGTALVEPEPEPEPVLAPVLDPVPAPVPEPVPEPVLEQVLAGEATGLLQGVRSRVAAATGRRTDPVADLGSALRALVEEDPPRRVVARLVTDVLTACGSDVALLRQRAPTDDEAAGREGGEDGGRDDGGDWWEVVGGAGLRPVETRPVHGLPGPVASLDGHHAVLCVSETDALRSELAGLPLARHRSLLVLRHPADLLVVAGREEPFGAREVRLVVDALHDALPQLRRGWEVEALLTGLVDWLEG